ncbi:MAG: VCBS repeat-containing protein [Phycisphaerales bacterium]|nr:VCBS repeat-containing protein [Phycisphaerales bacterium]
MPSLQTLVVIAQPLCAIALLSSITPAVRADDQETAAHYGFDGLDVVKIDRGAGPITSADMNGDGLIDLIAVNNAKSRIELHEQKKNASPDDPIEASLGTNESPPLWRFNRVEVPVSHQVTAVIPHDFDSDGLMDLVYAGQPGTIVFLRQTKPGTFEVARRVPVKGLSQSRDGFLIADFIDDAKPELAALVNGKPTIWPLEGSKLGEATELASGDPLVALLVGDFDGDGSNDLAGVTPDNAAPIRLWLASTEDGKHRLGSQRRFELPPLREAAALQLPGAKKTLLALIERPSKRIVIEEIVTGPSTGGEAVIEVFSAGESGKKRSYATADLDGDGLSDVLATDPSSSAVLVFRQAIDRGLQPSRTQPSFAELTGIEAGATSSALGAEVFVLSEKEGVVGRSRWDNGALSFPTAMPLSAGSTPLVIALVRLEGGPRLAVVTKDGKNYQLELLPLDGSADAKTDIVKLGALVKAPETVMGCDADQDGKVDLLLFTQDKPMTMLRSTETGFVALESKDMAQFGLVQAANGSNTAAFDVNGDGKQELVVADRNFIRALRFDSTATPAGWQVVTQVNAARSDAKLVSIAALDNQLIAGDKENSQLVVFAQAEGKWSQSDALTVGGFKFGPIRTGAFSGGSSTDVLLIGDDGFAVARLTGNRVTLEERGSRRGDRPNQLDHELASGDVNNDGFLDLLSLDAGEQSLSILSFSENGALIPGTSFKVFETRLFQGGEPREFEPSMCLIADFTGDGHDDVALLAHDRVLLYPQAAPTKK